MYLGLPVIRTLDRLVYVDFLMGLTLQKIPFFSVFFCEISTFFFVFHFPLLFFPLELWYMILRQPSHVFATEDLGLIPFYSVTPPDYDTENSHLPRFPTVV